jgi:hypothetical protein
MGCTCPAGRRDFQAFLGAAAGARPPHPVIEDSGQLPGSGASIRLGAGRVHATAIMYTPNLSPWREEAQIIRRNLKPLGIDVQVKEFPIGDFYTRVTRRGEPPPDTRFPRIQCRSWRSSSTSRRPSARTSRTSTTPPSAESSRRSRSCRARSATEPPAGSLSSSSTTPSRRPVRDDGEPRLLLGALGCQVYQPVWGIDLAALCLRG